MSSKHSSRSRLRNRDLASFSFGAASVTLPISRKVVTRRTKRVVGYFQSLKMQNSVPWESQIERDYLYCLEFEADILAFSAQPGHIRLTIDGAPRTHFPDFLIQYKDGRKELHEVKTDKDATSPDLQPLFEAARCHCANIGIAYRVICESDIRQQPRLSNCQQLLHHRRRPTAFEEEIRVISLLTDGPASFTALKQKLDDRHDAESIILSLAGRGRIRFQLDAILTGSTDFFLVAAN